MDIQKAKIELITYFDRAIFAIHYGTWDKHPLRVVQAVKTLIGINISSPNTKLLMWVKEYCLSIERRPESELMFEISDLNETVNIHSLDASIKNGDKKLSFFHLWQLVRVSDGRPILELLLELSNFRRFASSLFTAVIVTLLIICSNCLNARE